MPNPTLESVEIEVIHRGPYSQLGNRCVGILTDGSKINIPITGMSENFKYETNATAGSHKVQLEFHGFRVKKVSA